MTTYFTLVIISAIIGFILGQIVTSRIHKENLLQGKEDFIQIPVNKKWSNHEKIPDSDR